MLPELVRTLATCMHESCNAKIPAFIICGVAALTQFAGGGLFPLEPGPSSPSGCDEFLFGGDRQRGTGRVIKRWEGQSDGSRRRGDEI